jgi:membrane protein
MQIYFLEREGIVSLVIKLTPYILMVFFFTLIYLIIPNTKVKLTNAFIAGVFTAVLYNLIQLILLRSQVFLLNYNKIYGSFSVVPIFIIWQKAIWFIIILGAHLSFIIQNSYKFGYTIGEARMCIRSKREALFAIVYILTQNYRMEKPPLNIEELGHRLSISMGEVGQLVEALLDVDIILEVSTPSEERLFKINKNINTFTLGKFIEIIETYGHSRKIGGEELEGTMERFNESYRGKEWNTLIKDL